MTQEEEIVHLDPKDVGIVTDPVEEISCSRCGCRIDVRGVAPFFHVQCPDCGQLETVPARLGHFLLLSLLGTGGMGGVYLARDETLGRSVAIKVMLKSLGDNEEFVETFKREAQAAAKLNHPNIAQIYSFGQEKGQPYIVMELVSGKRFDKMMEAEKQLDQALVIQIALDLCQGLQVADENGLVHGDIKPENILLDEKMNAKLVDFGLAAVTNRAAEGGIWGTPYYIPPERVLRKKLDARSDIYSLGATLYHALAGQPPFEGETPAEVIKARLDKMPRPLHELRPDIKKEVEDVITRMLQPHPAQRYPNYTSLISDLQKALRALGASPGTRIVRGAKKIVLAKKRTSLLGREAEHPISPLRENVGATDQKEKRRRKTSPVFVGFMGILMLLIAGYGVWKFLFAEPRKHRLRAREEEYRLSKIRKEALLVFAAIETTHSNIVTSAAGTWGHVAAATNALFGALQRPVDMNLLRPAQDSGETVISTGTNRTPKTTKEPGTAAPSVPGPSDAREEEIVRVVRAVIEEAARLTNSVSLAGKLFAQAQQLADQVREAKKPWTVERRLPALGNKLAELRRIERDVTTSVKASIKGVERAEALRKVAEKERLEKQRAAEEAAKLREEEERQRQEAERLRVLASTERQQATAAHVEIVDLVRKNQFEEAHKRLKEQLTGYQTPEGRAALQVYIERLERLQRMKAFLVKRLSAEPLKWGWGQGASATDVLGADETGVRIKQGTVPWSEVPPVQMLKFLRIYLSDRSLRATELGELNLAAAIYCEENGASDLSRQFAEKAVDLFPSLADAVKRLLPEEEKTTPSP
ncbi:MAG: serine/threonine protein kinase [Kiritimatiellae bacterium]|nr:serine/threonine protein kinase [Kiritimatiellia bacterium]